MPRPTNTARRASRALFAVFGTALLGTLAACSGIEAPRFQLVSVAETERTERGAVLTFTLEAQNPGPEPLPLRQASYALTLNGDRVFSGSRSAEATIAGFTSQRIELPAVVPADDFDLRLLDEPGVRYALTGGVEYQTPGQIAEVLFDSGVRRPKAPLGIRGVLE